MTKKLLALLLALCMVFALTACGSGGKSATPTSAPESAAPATEGPEAEAPTGEPAEIFNIDACIASEPETMDPNLQSSVDGSCYTQHMFEGLMKYVTTGEQVVDDVSMINTTTDYGQAESYTVSDDGLVYTFTLKDGMVWSDGQPVTAADFVYSWQRLVDAATAADYGYLLNGIVLNAAAIQAGEMEPSELGVKAVDDKTFEVTLESECPYFLDLCCFAALMPLRQDVIESLGAEWTNPGNIVVNGPYIMTEWVHDSYIKMVPNESYYNVGELGPDSITWWLNDSETSILAAYQAGEYDFAENLPTDQIASLKASGDLFINPYVGTYYLYLNTEKITDWRVRAALVLSVDREYLVENVTQGGQVPATGFVPSGITDSQENNWAEETGEVMYAWLAEQYPDYDLSSYDGRCELAQALYQEAVDEGAWDPNTTVEYNFNTSESHKAIAEAVQSDWSTVLGVSCTLANQDWNVYTDGLSEGNFSVARLGWIADYNDAITYLELITNGNSYNYGRWVSDEYTGLITDAKALGGGTERDGLLYEAEALHFAEDGFTVCPIYFYTNIYVMHDGVENVLYTPFGYFFFMYATQG